jgi:phosphatidylglycerophosphatase C
VTRHVVAAFDFDGTLTRSDSVVRFLRPVGGRRKLVLQLARHAPSVAIAAARRDRDRIKALATDAVFRSVPRARVDALALQFGRSIAVRGLRDDVVARLGWHLEQGHHVVIVSAGRRQLQRGGEGQSTRAMAVATRPRPRRHRAVGVR